MPTQLPLKTIILPLFIAFAFALPAQGQEEAKVAEGKKLFTENCITCHKLGEDLIGPNLVGVLERRKPEWVKAFIKNSTRLIEQGDAEAKAVYEKYNKIQMTAFEGVISEEGIEALVSFLKVAQPEAPPVQAAAATASGSNNAASQAAPASSTSFKLSDNDKIILSVFAAFVVVVLAILAALVSQLISLQRALEARKQVQQVPQPVAVVKRIPELGKGIWSDIRGLFSGIANNELMEGHVYDGIQEMDNGMPPWLAYFFYVTIIFGVVYMLNYHVLGLGDLQEAEYKAEVAEATMLYGQSKDKVKIPIVPITDKAQLDNAAKIFAQNCAACHGKALEGGVGPNLTDKYYLHGGKLADIFNTIREGVPAKGMIAWKGKLSDEEILQLASYIKSKEGSNPPNAKAPQGVEMK
ncbi:MAG: c-type cytochrome [Cytophagales bacterium]|nr:c-type cytochrome [Bernardetiaceae bacterium]MDW8210515.1 c-type cytochrome [Cytophagales bacterium]